MVPLRTHIDLTDPAASALLSDAVRELGWEITMGALGPVPPDLLVTVPGNISEHTLRLKAEFPGLQVILWTDSMDSDPPVPPGAPVFAMLRPGDSFRAVIKVLEDAGREREKHRGDHSVRNDLEERLTEASVIMNLALELTPGMRIDEVLDIIVGHIYQDLGYKIVSIMLLDEKGEYLKINAARGLAEKIVRSSQMEIGKGVSGSVAQSGEPLLIRDVEKNAKFGKGRSHGRYSSKSLICVPLKVEDRVIGVLNANNKKSDGPLNEHDLHILTVFAAHVSNNIERTRLHDNMRQQAEELRNAYEKLRHIDKIKSDFIINVSHEYRTPVTIILGYLELLRSSFTEEPYLEKIETAMEAANRLSSLIDDSTDLLRLDTGTTVFHFQLVEPHHFLEEAVRNFWPRFGGKGVDLSLDLPEDLPRVRVDVDKMIKTFEKLLDNALKFTPQGGVASIGASPTPDGGVVVSVEDSGAGVGDGDRDRLFERFEQGGDIMTEKPEGTGLGLPIARAIVRRHGGAISMDETVSAGCRIFVSLPPAGSVED